MQGVQFVLLVLLLNASCGIIGDTGLFTSSAPDSLYGRVNETLILNNLGGNATSEAYVSENFDSSKYLGDAIKVFFGVIWNTTFGFPQMLASAPFNVPAAWVTLIVALQTIIYTLFAIEILRGINIL